MLLELLGLGSEADGERPSLRQRGDRGQHVGALHQVQVQRRRLLLDLLPGGLLRAIVGHRGGADVDVRLRGARQRRLVHLGRGLDVDAFHAWWRRDLHRPGNQRYPGTSLGRGLCHSEAHLAGAAVADEPHRIDGLARRACRHQHAPAGQRAVRHAGQGDQRRDDLRRFAHAARAALAAGLRALGGADEAQAARGEQRTVVTRRRMRPHDMVHGRRQQQWCAGRQAQGGQQVGGEAGGEFGHHIRRGRGDDHEVRPARELDVAHGGLGLRVPEVLAHRLAGDGLEHRGRDHAGGAAGHDHAYLGTLVTQAADDIRALVGGDAT